MALYSHVDRLPLAPVLDSISQIKVNVYVAIKDVFLTLIYPLKVGLACMCFTISIPLGEMCPTKTELYLLRNK